MLKMRIKISILLFIPFQFISLSVCYAQSDILNNYIKDALSNNLSIQSEILKEEKQYSKVEQANKLWKPTVDLNIA